MLNDFHDYPADAEIVADLCIIGAGVVGITIAREFAGKSLKVCLLESGGPDFEAKTQALYQGKNLGQPYYDLDDSRLRFFGGTTLVWGGRCVPLDPIDFEPRRWVPYSGWPFPRTELVPYYERAQQVLDLGPFVYDEHVWKGLEVDPPDFDPLSVRTGFWQFDEEFSRFGLGKCEDLKRADNIRIVLHANVTNIEAHPSGQTVERLDITTLDGKRGSVRARVYVLAAGGIENPRLLLVSNGAEPNGLGNRHDCVGRFFMEHPHGRAARISTPTPYSLWDVYRKHRNRHGELLAPVLRAGEDLQKSAEILNSSLTLKCQRRSELGVPMGKEAYRVIKKHLHPTTSGRRIWRTYKQINRAIHRMTDTVVRRRQLRSGHSSLCLIIRGEQAPNPDSRIVLSSQRDVLGVRQADLDWRFTELDKRSVAVLVDALDREFQRLALGRVIPEEWLSDDTTSWPVDPTVSNHAIGGYHHMGTTRMADQPLHGVVNRDTRVHGINNLYVAGSSVFPTAGWANPVLTTIALSLRLTDHLQAWFSRST